MNLEIIIPVGPGHELLHQRAVASVAIAKLEMGPFQQVRCRVIDDTAGEHGRSAARNHGVRQSDADWLFFLDADDVMLPHALHHFRDLTRYDAVWGQITELKDGCLAQRWQVPEVFDFRTLLAFDPYLTLQMGHFVRREVALANPFNEQMDTGEDWDYYLRLWRSYRCAKRARPLFANDRSQHAQGPRSATGVQWREVVGALFEQARAEAAGD